MGGGMGADTAPSPVDSVPLATGDTPEGDVNLSMNYYEFDPNDFNVDLEDAFLSDDEIEQAEQESYKVQLVAGTVVDTRVFTE